MHYAESGTRRAGLQGGRPGELLPAFKGCSRKLQDEHLDGINKLLDTKFTRDDMELIYTYLGNGIQHDLCLRFVASGYDLEIIREEERKQ